MSILMFIFVTKMKLTNKPIIKQNGDVHIKKYLKIIQQITLINYTYRISHFWKHKN